MLLLRQTCSRVKEAPRTASSTRGAEGRGGGLLAVGPERGVEGAQAAQVGGRVDSRRQRLGRCVGATRWLVATAPVLGVVAGAGGGLDGVPVGAAICLQGSLAETRGRPPPP